jgi:hypothetical protein
MNIQVCTNSRLWSRIEVETVLLVNLLFRVHNQYLKYFHVFKFKGVHPFVYIRNILYDLVQSKHNLYIV